METIWWHYKSRKYDSGYQFSTLVLATTQPGSRIQAGLIFAGALGIATLLPGLKDKGNKGERNDRPHA